MKRHILWIIISLGFVLYPLHQLSHAADLTLNNTPTQVCFSPQGGCTEAIVGVINGAKTEVLVQAYSLTSAPIAKQIGDRLLFAQIGDKLLYGVMGWMICAGL
jgi:hypothetical protein